MQILSFDTSGPDIQIALMQDGEIVHEDLIPPAQKNRQESASLLLPTIDSAFKKLDWQKRDLDLIVVGVGPGSFTGVRVAVITARSIGQALGIGVIPVDRLELVAYRSKRPCLVALDAGADKLYIGGYGEDLCGKSLLAPYCGSRSDLQMSLSIVDSVVPETGINVDYLANSITILPYPSQQNLAADAARLAQARLLSRPEKLSRESLSKAYPWDNVLPLYLRSPSVTLKTGNGSPN